MDWHDLDEEQQQAAVYLGYSEDIWNAPENLNEKMVADLSRLEKEAAGVLEQLEREREQRKGKGEELARMKTQLHESQHGPPPRVSAGKIEDRFVRRLLDGEPDERQQQPAQLYWD